jgi:hypothetical protein
MAAAAAAASAAKRQEWQASLQVGDLLDCDILAWAAGSDLHRAWYVCRVPAATSATITSRPLSWDVANGVEQVARRTVEWMQPLGTKTEGKYTEPPERLKAVLQSQLQPSLDIQLHPEHQLQRFCFDFDWQCSKCAKQKSAGQSQSYSCLPCKYDLCVDCFIDNGGIDKHQSSLRRRRK